MIIAAWILFLLASACLVAVLGGIWAGELDPQLVIAAMLLFGFATVQLLSVIFFGGFR